MKRHYLFIIYCFSIFSCSRNVENLKIKGSDTEVNLTAELAEQFFKVNKHYSVSVSGGGSGLGIASLINGQADIANSSRPLSDEEKELIDKHGIELKTVVFAEDATAIIVNKAIPLSEIDVPTLAAILEGSVTSWKELDGPDLPINIYGRQSSSGTHSFIQSKLKIKFAPTAKEMNGNAQIIEGVKLDRSGIGYVGAGYIAHQPDNNQIRVLNIKPVIHDAAVSPLDEEAIRNGQYYLQRPLYQFIRSESWDKARVFIDFEKGSTGQALIKNSGYYLTNDSK